MTLVDKIFSIIQECSRKFLHVSFYNKQIAARYMHLHVIFKFLKLHIESVCSSQKVTIDVSLKEEINRTTTK